MLKINLEILSICKWYSHFARYIKKNQINYWIYISNTEGKLYQKVNNYFIETIPRFTTDDFQSMSLYCLQQLALEVAIML